MDIDGCRVMAITRNKQPGWWNQPGHAHTSVVQGVNPGDAMRITLVSRMGQKRNPSASAVAWAAWEGNLSRFDEVFSPASEV